MFSAFSCPIALPNTNNTIKRPRSAKPATQRPITLPPWNAVFSVVPSFLLVLALFATLTFVIVAIFIPTNAANKLIDAPITNAIPTYHCTNTVSTA